MRSLLIIFSAIITVSAVIPYIIDVFKKKTKPRVVSWFIWALLGGIAAAASLSDGQYAAFVLSGSASLECLLVVMLGFKYGEKELAPFDVICFVGAIVGLILWYIFNSPAIAIAASILIDLIGSLPTLKHAWQKPDEETWVTFALSGTGAALAIFAATSVRVTSLAVPIYIVAINAAFTSILLSRGKIKQVL